MQIKKLQQIKKSWMDIHKQKPSWNRIQLLELVKNENVQKELLNNSQLNKM